MLKTKKEGTIFRCARLVQHGRTRYLLWATRIPLQLGHYQEATRVYTGWALPEYREIVDDQYSFSETQYVKASEQNKKKK